MADETVHLSLTEDEALVLYEWLRRLGEAEEGWVDQAEQRVVWDVTCLLEPQLPLFAHDYLDRLGAAREEVRDPPA